MANKLINSLTSGSVSSSLLTLAGDPVTGKLYGVDFQQIADFINSEGTYNPINLNGSTASLQTFSASILTYTSSLNTQVTNVFTSQSNYELTSSFNTFSSSYHTDSASFNTRIGSGGGITVDGTTLLVANNTASINLSGSNIWTSDSGIQIRPITTGNAFVGGLIIGNFANGLRYSIQSNESTGEIKHNAVGSYFPTFYSSNAEAMRIDTSQNVLIGTKVTGTGKLQVSGSTSFSGSILLAPSTTNGAALNFASGSAPSAPKTGDIWFDATGSLKIQINGVTKTFTLS